MIMHYSNYTNYRKEENTLYVSMKRTELAAFFSVTTYLRYVEGHTLDVLVSTTLAHIVKPSGETVIFQKLAYIMTH